MIVKTRLSNNFIHWAIFKNGCSLCVVRKDDEKLVVRTFANSNRTGVELLDEKGKLVAYTMSNL